MAVDFQNLKVITFESRRADEMVALIERYNGQAISAPSMREVTMESCPEALAFADQLEAGQIDMTILLTGVGTRKLVEALKERLPQERFVELLSKTTVVARGPKPVAALRELGAQADVVVGEPNTWEDILKRLDAEGGVQGKRVAIQEYGVPNEQLLQGLEQRGAEVVRVPIYKWELPEDLGPLKNAIGLIADGGADIALFTSATQVYHLFEVAEREGKTDALREGFRRVVIGSVGPIATEAIRTHWLMDDYEPDAPHMSPLVKELARRGPYLLERKRVAHASGVDTNDWRRIDMRWEKPAEEGGTIPTIDDSVFLKACRREPVPYTPVWIMRQAGRYQRAYRDVRAKVSMLELCRTPELASEVTLMAVDRLGVDAAIIFADILLVCEPMGLRLEFARGEGPVIYNPIETRADLDRLESPEDASALRYVCDAITLTRRALRPDIALIGFSGSPFTVASYMVEGGKTKNFAKTKTMMYRDRATWDGLMEKLCAYQIKYLNAQIDAGADALQLFDSWGGQLSPDDYREYVAPYVKRMVEGVNGRVPVINFSTGNPTLLPIMKETGGDVIGMDWRVDLREAWDQLGPDVAVQGNLDPVTLYASTSDIRERAGAVLAKANNQPGHIFNLGHGVSPDMDPQRVADLVDAVHELSARV
ncbi:MAG: uroporphyrinogen decarboxylase [Planctomycetota bacterium]|jgi:uroporphyrinogen decarboxylase